MHPRLTHAAWALAAALLAHAAHAAANGPVCLYKNANYGGKPNCKSADTPKLKDTWNDKTSSVKVAAGYEAAVAALQRPHGLFQPLVQTPAGDLAAGDALEAAE